MKTLFKKLLLYFIIFISVATGTCICAVYAKTDGFKKPEPITVENASITNSNINSSEDNILPNDVIVDPSVNLENSPILSVAKQIISSDSYYATIRFYSSDDTISVTGNIKYLNFKPSILIDDFDFSKVAIEGDFEVKILDFCFPVNIIYKDNNFYISLLNNYYTCTTDELIELSKSIIKTIDVDIDEEFDLDELLNNLNNIEITENGNSKYINAILPFIGKFTIKCNNNYNLIEAYATDIHIGDKTFRLFMTFSRNNNLIISNINSNLYEPISGLESILISAIKTFKNTPLGYSGTLDIDGFKFNINLLISSNGNIYLTLEHDNKIIKAIINKSKITMSAFGYVIEDKLSNVISIISKFVNLNKLQLNIKFNNNELLINDNTCISFNIKNYVINDIDINYDTLISLQLKKSSKLKTFTINTSNSYTVDEITSKVTTLLNNFKKYINSFNIEYTSIGDILNLAFPLLNTISNMPIGYLGTIKIFNIESKVNILIKSLDEFYIDLLIDEFKISVIIKNSNISVKAFGNVIYDSVDNFINLISKYITIPKFDISLNISNNKLIINDKLSVTFDFKNSSIENINLKFKDINFNVSQNLNLKTFNISTKNSISLNEITNKLITLTNSFSNLNDMMNFSYDSLNNLSNYVIPTLKLILDNNGYTGNINLLGYNFDITILVNTIKNIYITLSHENYTIKVIIKDSTVTISFLDNVISDSLENFISLISKYNILNSNAIDIKISENRINIGENSVIEFNVDNNTFSTISLNINDYNLFLDKTENLKTFTIYTSSSSLKASDFDKTISLFNNYTKSLSKFSFDLNMSIGKNKISAKTYLNLDDFIVKEIFLNGKINNEDATIISQNNDCYISFLNNNIKLSRIDSNEFSKILTNKLNLSNLDDGFSSQQIINLLKENLKTLKITKEKCTITLQNNITVNITLNSNEPTIQIDNLTIGNTKCALKITVKSNNELYKSIKDDVNFDDYTDIGSPDKFINAIVNTLSNEIKLSGNININLLNINLSNIKIDANFALKNGKIEAKIKLSNIPTFASVTDVNAILYKYQYTNIEIYGEYIRIHRYAVRRINNKEDLKTSSVYKLKNLTSNVLVDIFGFDNTIMKTVNSTSSNIDQNEIFTLNNLKILEDNLSLSLETSKINNNLSDFNIVVKYNESNITNIDASMNYGKSIHINLSLTTS